LTWPLEPGAGPADLGPRRGADGSFSLWSEAFGEGFHSAAGALSEAQEKFVRPSQLDRWRPGQGLVVVEVAVGTGTNTAALLQATAGLDLPLQWWGLEQDPQPLALALASECFRSQWPAPTLTRLEALVQSDRLLWGDGRQAITRLPAALQGGCDLVWLDAFSPRRCPQLWSLEFLAQLAALLRPEGRLITYSSAAAVRAGLVAAGLQLASIAASDPDQWSGGTVASPTPLGESFPLRSLTAKESDHLLCSAAEPYLDPTGQASAATLLAERRLRQSQSRAVSGSAWRRRWGVASGFCQGRGLATEDGGSQQRAVQDHRFAAQGNRDQKGEEQRCNQIRAQINLEQDSEF
jgi:tRNA U34 5-methylaminomethyl-2-thiouridine-forming methyltransferase MnmC